jgi:lysophospholipase L1-like esterase
VICAGDSVTAGYGVGDDDAYPSLLRERLRRIPGLAHATVINLGVYGYSSEQGRKLLDGAVARFRPDAVVVEYGINDSALSAYPDTLLIADDGTVRRTQKLLARTHLYRALRDPIVRLKIRRHSASGLSGARVSPERYADNLRAIVRLVRAAGAAPVLVSPTSKWERGVKPHVVTAHPERILTAHEMHVYRHVMAAVAAEESVPRLSLPLLEGLTPESPARFPDWCHPDAEGLCLLAEQLAPLVAETLAGRGAR